MLLLVISLLLLFASGMYKYWRMDRELEALRLRSLHVWQTNRQVHRTLAVGLYHRFKRENSNDPGTTPWSDVYLRNNPYEFAYFVAEILEGTYGGTAYVTLAAEETGIDIEHERKEGLYLIQVRCSPYDLGVEPIAILHSQVVKHKAHGGWLVTTGGITEEAKRYAKETDVVWVDGIRLVELWSDYLERMEHQKDMEPAGGYKPALS